MNIKCHKCAGPSTILGPDSERCLCTVCGNCGVITRHRPSVVILLPQHAEHPKPNPRHWPLLPKQIEDAIIDAIKAVGFGWLRMNVTRADVQLKPLGRSNQ